MSLSEVNIFLVLGIFTVIVVTIFLFEYHRLRQNLLRREREMDRRMYQLSILRELGERIGYSLKIDKIVEIIAGSLNRLLDYSTIAYMILTPTPDGKAQVRFNIHLETPVSKKFIEDVRSKMLLSLNALANKQFVEDTVEEEISGTITDHTSAVPVGSFFNVPITIGGSVVGVLNIAST